MTLKSWSTGCVLVCGITSVLACRDARAQNAPAPARTPAVALVDAADAAQWQAWLKDLGWRVITPAAAANANIDQRVLALATAVAEANRNGGVDATRVYLAGRGDASAAVFYTISRIPDLWAAGLALGGSPEPAVDSDRLFAANFAHVPVLWAGAAPADEALAAKLKTAGLNLEWRPASGLTIGAAFEWLASHRREEFPSEIDCETNSPAFARCYWIEMSKFDVGERNDVLPSTRMVGGSGAALDLGGFGYKTDDPGPGLLVTFLPEKYAGPLKLGDRLTALDGRPIQDAKQFGETMAKFTEEKPVTVMVQRGKERTRVESRIILRRRDANPTARVEAQYLPADNVIQIVSRTVKEMRVTIPPAWAENSRLYWNGLSLEKIESAGCFLLTVEKELLHAARCP